MKRTKTKSLCSGLMLIMLLACLAVVNINSMQTKNAYAETEENANIIYEAETMLSSEVTQHETFAAAWKYANDNSHAGAVSVKLLKNCVTSVGLVVNEGKNIILDLNGFSLDRGLNQAITDGYVIKIIGKFTLDDSLTGGMVTGGNNLGSGGGLYAVESSEVIILDGIISDNYAQQGGGGICINQGKISINGGKIANNNGNQQGGGIYADRTEVTFNNGEISSNIANIGGGIYMAKGSLTIGIDAKVTNNTANYGGGGIYGATAVMAMNGGEISSNQAIGAGGGGGIYCYGGSEFKMAGGVIKDNQAVQNTTAGDGGGVYFSNGTFSMSGDASITGNTANSTGGGVSINYSTFTMSENASITSNIVKGKTIMNGGGGLYLANTIATLNNATISDNTAGSNCGGIYLTSSSKLKVNGGTISTSSYYAIYLIDKSCEITIEAEPSLLSGNNKSHIITSTAITFTNINIAKNYKIQWNGSLDKGTALIKGCEDLSKFTFEMDKSKKAVALENSIIIDTYAVKVSKVVSNNFIALYTDDIIEAIKSVKSTENATLELFKDVNVNETLEIIEGATVNLKLNGNNIIGQGIDLVSLIKVNGTFIIKESLGGEISTSSGYAVYADSGNITFDGNIALTSESGNAQIFTKNTIKVSLGVTLSNSYTVKVGETNTLGLAVVTGATVGFTLVNENFAVKAEDNNLLLYATIAIRPTENTSTFTYTGHEQTYEITASEYYTVSSNKRTNSGSQNVIISLSQYFLWTDGTNDDVTFNFTIHKANIEKPTEDISVFTYTGLKQTYNPLNFNSLFMTISNNEQKNASVLGYNVTVVLDADNCLWNTGGAENLTFNFIISKRVLTVTAKDHSIFYGWDPSSNGVTYAGFVNGENESTLSGNLSYTYGYTIGDNVGQYSITPFGLTSDNYEIKYMSGILNVKKLLDKVYLGGTNRNDANSGLSAAEAVSTANVAVAMVASGGKIIVCGDTESPVTKTLIENKEIIFTNTDGLNIYDNAKLKTYFPTFLSNVLIKNVLWQDVNESKQCEVGKNVTLTLDSVVVADDMIRYILARDEGAHLNIINSNFSGKVSYLCNFDTVTLDNSVATALYSKNFPNDAGNFILKNSSFLSVSMDIENLTSIGSGNTIEARKLTEKVLAPVKIKGTVTIEDDKPIFLTNFFKKELVNGVPFLVFDDTTMSIEKFTLAENEKFKFALYKQNNTIYAVERTVTEVSVNSDLIELQRGQTAELTATVTGKFSPSQKVKWSVSGGKSGTFINENGILTIADDEAFVVLTVTAVSIQDETKSCSIEITVVKRNLSETNFGTVTDKFVYNRTENKPTISITDNGKINASDYEFFYKDNINAGEATLIVQATESGNYLGKIEIKFIIEKATQTIDTTKVILNYTYNGEIHTINEGAFIEDYEQTLIYKNNTFTTVNEGNGKIVTIFAEETQNYKSISVEITINVQKAYYDMSSIYFSDKTIEYDGKSHSLVIEGDLPIGADGIALSVTYEGSAIDVGQFNVTAIFATESDNYNVADNMTATINIISKEININWIEDNFTYNGNCQKDDVTATYKDVNNQIVPLKLSSGEFKDYSKNGVTFVVSFANNETNYKLPANATSKKYFIKKLAVSIIANNAEMTYGGSVPSLDWKYVDGSERFILKDNIALTVTTDASSLSDANGIYYTKISPLINNNYEITYGDGVLSINKREITVAIDNATSVYGNALSNLTGRVTVGSIINEDLPFSLNTTATTTSNVGDNYTITGETINLNYEVTFIDAAYSISKRTLTENMVLKIDDVIYNGQKHEPKVTVSDNNLLNENDYIISYFHNVDAGEAVVIITAQNNYIGEIEKRFVIEKAEIDMRGIAFEDKTVVYNGTMFSIEITGELPQYVTVTYTDGKIDAGVYTMTAKFTANANYKKIADMSAVLTIRFDKQVQPSDNGESDNVIIESDKGIDPTLKLNAKDVTEKFSPPTYLQNAIGKNREIKQVFDVKLLNADRVEVQPDGMVKVKLLLNDSSRNLGELKLYSIKGDTMTELEITRDGAYIVFSTSNLAEFAIVGDVVDNGLPLHLILVISIGGLIILVLIIILILTIIKKNRKKEI